MTTPEKYEPTEEEIQRIANASHEPTEEEFQKIVEYERVRLLNHWREITLAACKARGGSGLVN